MSKYKIIKTIVFIILGTLVLIFNNHLVDDANFLVGGLMLLYGIEDIAVKVVKKEIKEELPKFFNDILIIILGVILFFLGKEEHFVTLCVIWATWAILREEWEVSEVIHNYKVKFMSVINILESIGVVIISVFFIFSPTLHHLHLHVVILGIELILEVLFPLCEICLRKKIYNE